jgi:lambda repressor-like predicted transcriptional regulator
MDAQTATIRLRREAFTSEALQQYGWASPTAAARAIGVSSSTLRRAIAGEITPGERLIAALLTGTGKTFDDLFTLS